VSKTINLTLKVWRQNGFKQKGHFETHSAHDISTDMSFLEMLDVVNEQLTLTARSRSPLTTIVAKAFAACAAP
jgi:succinate dehydrogenase / fumarate reductase, iron-sulfur subunit